MKPRTSRMPSWRRSLFSRSVSGHVQLEKTSSVRKLHRGAETYQGASQGRANMDAVFTKSRATWPETTRTRDNRVSQPPRPARSGSDVGDGSMAMATAASVHAQLDGMLTG